MTEPGRAPDPGERRLAHPPSDRYRSSDAAGRPSADAAGRPRPGESVDVDARVRVTSPMRGLLDGTAIGIGGALLIAVLGGVVTITDGLLVVAAVIGWSVAWAVRIGAGASLPRRRRTLIAMVIAIAGVALGQVGLWWYAGVEGGVLPLVDYLGETFGPLVVAQLVIAPLVAALSAR